MPQRLRLFRPAEPPRGVGTAMALWVVYAFTAMGVVMFCKDGAGNTAFYPANGVIVAGLLVLPRRLSLWFCLACLGFNLCQNLMGQFDVGHSLLYAMLNQTLSLVVATLIRSVCGAATDLSRVRRLSTFALVVMACGTVEAAIGQSISMVMDGDHSYFLRAWLQWAAEDSLGLLIAIPAVLLPLKSGRSVYACIASPVERWLLLALAAGLTLMAFSQVHSFTFVLIYPLLMLTAFRAGPPWVSASVLTTAFIAIACTAHGLGPIVYLAGQTPIWPSS